MFSGYCDRCASCAFVMVRSVILGEIAGRLPNSTMTAQVRTRSINVSGQSAKWAIKICLALISDKSDRYWQRFFGSRKRRDTLVLEITDNLGLLARRDRRSWVQQEDLRLAMCFFVPLLRCDRHYLDHFKTSTRSHGNSTGSDAKQQYH